ncbi:MAG: hypothetical protein KKB51_13100 [Candidatus Riflebacteria bacterium]|nr:hypothetical protein [Candidatus Riflebacteria bacterium]
MDKELIQQLYSSNVESKRATVYRLLFDRRHDLLQELKKAATFEKDNEIAVFMVQVCLTLENFPRDFSLERRIIELLQKEGGAVSVSEEMWRYLETSGSSQMILAALGAMGNAIPPAAQEFIEACLTHLDPEIRASVCQKAIKSGRPTHFAFVLNLITDPDPMVAQTAFSVIKEVPGDELAIILDYALGSPDEWVLDNVAPFLPHIINNAVRKVIAKVSYHKHPLIAVKAREALKMLDAIPFISKRKAEEEAAAAAEKKAAEDADGSAEEGEIGEDGEKVFSLKEQMELKRQQKLEEEQKRKAEDEAMAAELASVKPEDLAELAGEIRQFNADPGTEGADDSIGEIADEMIADEQTLAEDTSFEDETRILDDIEINDSELEKILTSTTPVKEELVASASKDVSVRAEEEEVIVLDPDEIDFEKVQSHLGPLIQQTPHVVADIETEIETFVADDEDIDILVVDETAVTAEPVKYAAAAVPSDPEKKVELPVAGSNAGSSVSVQPAVSSPSVVQEKIPSTTLDGKASTASVPAKPNAEAVSAPTPKTPPTVQGGVVAPVPARPVQTVKPVQVAKPAPVAPGARPVLPPEAREIAARYPSFLVDPYIQLFVPASNEARLAQIGQVVDNLTAFLNLCYLQSCLFFAPESEMLARSIIDCIKGELSGPTALRCLHNFVLSMKQARGNPVFFTFSLASVLSDTSDANPLMMMRELKEFLREPVTPLEESIPQAIEGVTEILRGVKSIVNNLLVMKAPPGAKEPFADLSGPEARILTTDKRPALDLPVGEVILISRDGNEALGLFPYFKYARKKIVFAKPSIAERNILLERLEIPVEEF